MSFLINHPGATSSLMRIPRGATRPPATFQTGCGDSIYDRRSVSERKFRTQLNRPRITNGNYISVGGVCNVRLDRTEVCVIENIECFGSELQVEPFADFGVLE